MDAPASCPPDRNDIPTPRHLFNFYSILSLILWLQAVFYAEQLLEHGGPVAHTRDGPVKLPPPGDRIARISKIKANIFYAD